MKKFSLLRFILIATTVSVVFIHGEAAAQSRGDCPQAFQGFSLGGNIGYGIGWTKHQFRWHQGGFNASSNLAVKGVDGGLGVGYTSRFGTWALGLGFDANWSGADGKSKVAFPQFFGQPTHANASVRLKNSLQLYGKLGYVIREIVQPFIALGWDNSQWKERASINLGSLFSASAERSKRLNGFMWKVGMDVLATQCIVFGFEYTGTITRRQKFNVTREIFGQPQTFSGSFRPQYNKFALTAKIIY